MDERLQKAIDAALDLLNKGNPHHDAQGRFASIGGAKNYKVSQTDQDHIGFKMLDQHSDDLLDRVPKYHIKEVHHEATKNKTRKLEDNHIDKAMQKLAKEHQNFYNAMNNEDFSNPHHKRVHKHGYWEM